MSLHRHRWEFIDRGGDDGHAKPARIMVRDPRPERGATERAVRENGDGTLYWHHRRVRRGEHRFLNVTGWCSGCGAVRCRDAQNRKRIFRPSEEASGA